jgi:hypothetical protein
MATCKLFLTQNNELSTLPCLHPNVWKEKTSSMVLASNMPKHFKIITRQLYACIKQLLLLSSQIRVANCSPLFSQSPQALWCTESTIKID